MDELKTLKDCTIFNEIFSLSNNRIFGDERMIQRVTNHKDSLEACKLAKKGDIIIMDESIEFQKNGWEGHLRDYPKTRWMLDFARYMDIKIKKKRKKIK
jgi:hypothetical protein